MVIKTGYQSEEILQVLNPISHYVQNKDIQALTQLMNITDSEATILKEFSVKDLGLKENSTTAESNIDPIPNNLIKIDIDFSSTQTPTSTFNPRKYLTNIRQGVLHCIWSNAYVREKDSSIQADYKNLILRIDDQIAKLNSSPSSTENLIIKKPKSILNRF